MRGIALFVSGLILGGVMMQASSAQQQKVESGLKLNHVGFNVKNFDESLNFYTKTMGFREAFTLRGPDGKPTLSYIQVSRETFLELAPATADRAPGLTHFSFEAPDVNATVTRLRAAGVKIDDARVSRTNTLLTSVIDPNGIRFEIAQLPPESLPKKAMESWK
ncbi:MAG TPA: VOC family protein [Candidatus Acidoferrales bacterium]|jgi:catechol 2,3-dioxygenase-like lactoylglutathione lyase family enzyme|nr:VOC family protein [Verrucomicrobiae bacterium]HZP33690.1 VOC family protein [Candidatus Acidoferrales bacterium]